MANRNNFITGVSEMLILKLLALEDGYVYGLCKSIHEISGDTLDISQNTVYSATYKLANQKYISEYSKLVGKRRTRIYYHIEEKGLQYLNQMENEYFHVANGVQTFYSNFPEMNALNEK